MTFKTRQTLRLMLAFALIEFKLRNEGSYLGFFWYLLNPILTFLLLLLIFAGRLGSSIVDYPLYLLMGIMLFNFFQFTTLESTRVIYNFRGVVRSIYFPKEVLVGQLVVKTFFSHIFEMLLYALFMVFFHVPFWRFLWYLPILVFLSFFTVGVSFALCALTVYVSDLENIWNFTLRLLWLATPIFYASEGILGISILNRLNPMYYFITVGRETVIYGHYPEPLLILGMVGFSAISFFGGLGLFGLFKGRFAEKI